jgi:hypothetical protein
MKTAILKTALIAAAFIFLAAISIHAFAQQAPVIANPGTQIEQPMTSADRYKNAPRPAAAPTANVPGDYSQPWTENGTPESSSLNSEPGSQPEVGPDGKPVAKKPIYNKLFDSLPRDIQDQIMAEAASVEQQCEQDPMYPYYHDCQCLGTKFIDARLNNPDARQENLRFNIRTQCVNTPGIAGYNYNYCYNKASFMVPAAQKMNDKQRDEYCKCFARTTAKMYEDAPDPSYSHITQQQVAAFGACANK